MLSDTPCLSSKYRGQYGFLDNPLVTPPSDGSASLFLNFSQASKRNQSALGSLSSGGFYRGDLSIHGTYVSNIWDQSEK